MNHIRFPFIIILGAIVRVEGKAVTNWEKERNGKKSRYDKTIAYYGEEIFMDSTKYLLQSEENGSNAISF